MCRKVEELTICELHEQVLSWMNRHINAGKMDLFFLESDAG